MPGLPAYRRITRQSQPDGGFLGRGELVLGLHTRVLRGPDNAVCLPPGDFAVMRLLLHARLVPVAEMTAAVVAVTGRVSARPEHALAQRIVRLRAVLVRVGVDGGAIENSARAGYRLVLTERDCRVFVGDRLTVLNHLLASHPDRAGVAFALGVRS